MAEIHVEPKKKSSTPIWIWVVVVLVVAAIIYFLVRNNDNNNANNRTNTTSYNSHLNHTPASGTMVLYRV